MNFANHELIKISLKEVEDDYDVCIMDCSPGRFMLHENIFNAADLVLIPTVPAPLSIYCNNMLIDSLQNNSVVLNKVLSFYNMVQMHKNLHRQYMETRHENADHILHHYIPFYSEIELITLTKESIFHQIKESRAHVYYHKLWLEICDRMNWELYNVKGMVVDMHQDEENPTQEPDSENQFGKISEG